MLAAREDRSYKELLNSRLLDAESTEMRSHMQQLTLDVETHIVEIEVFLQFIKQPMLTILLSATFRGFESCLS